MFDEIRCDFALPDGGRIDGLCFQTKSFPDPHMHRYAITSDGRLLDSAGHDIEPEGYLCFYTSEKEGALQDLGEGQLREYRARFVDGSLQEIARVDPNNRDERVFGLASFRYFAKPMVPLGGPKEK